MTGGTVPMWLWLLVVGAAVVVAVIVGHEEAPHCANCGRRLPRRTRIADRYSDGLADICAGCYLETFR